MTEEINETKSVDKADPVGSDAVGSEADRGENAAQQQDSGFDRAAAKARKFPKTPGVYLFKDSAGRVIYIGKAKDLRARASSYFLKAAAEEFRTAKLVKEIRDVDHFECESEVDALLTEARLIKDVQPKFNKEMRDDKSLA